MTRSMNERKPESHWSVPVAVHDVPPTGRHFKLAADEATRAAIAKSADLRALSRLAATFDVSRHGAGGLHVVGRVDATIGQVCVVSLEPIESEVEETVDLVFVPGAAPAPDDAAGRLAVVEVADEAPEPLLGDTVDLGAIATEFLILGIDLYPRKPGAVFQAPPAEDTAEHPFAALAALRRAPDGGDA
jgi:Large ribosomal RNA subunit accumulation protein YceD